MALLRFFLVGTVELNAQVNALTGNLSATATLLTYCFSYTLFGQLIDNISDVKKLFVAAEFCFAGWVIIMALVNYHSQAQITNGITARTDIWNYYVLPTDVFIIGALQLVQTIQLFNWFSRRRIGTVIGLFMAAQSLGLIFRFTLTGTFKEFPDEDAAEAKMLDNGFFRKTGNICAASGILFLGVAAFDSF